MEEERMLNDEILLGLIKSNSGGGGGTSDYEQLSNLPKIDGVELKGNKTAAQLGLATEQDLSGKQNALTAGDYIQFEGNEISVKRTLDVPTYVYNIKTPQHPYLVITKTLNGEQVSQTTYSYNGSTQQWTIDDLFTLKSYRNSSDVASWRIELISDAHEHDAGWAQEWDTNVYGQTGGVYDFDLTFDTIDVSGQTLVIKSEMDTALSGKQNTLTFDDAPTDGSNNPVKSNGVYDALALKQNATDNNLETTSKTVVGAVNELKSGLTNLSEEVNGDAVEYPYADVITIEDAIPANVADCSVKIEPVQDLHGYDHPWVGGAGSNQWDEDWESGAINGATGEKVPKDDKIRSKNYIAVTAGNNYYFVHESTAADLFFYDSNYQYLGYNDGHIVANTSMAFTVPSGASYMLFSILQTTYSSGIAINYPATVTSYAPYTNICPISGLTSGDIVDVGENELEIIKSLPFTQNGVTFTSDGNGGIYVNGTSTDSVITGTIWRTREINGGSCLKKFTSDTTAPIVFDGHWPNGNYYSPVNGGSDSSNKDGYWSFQIYIMSSGKTFNNVHLTPMVVRGSTAPTEFKPYQKATATITFGQTVYGGTVDFNTGVMTVDREYVLASTLTWTKHNSDANNVYITDTSESVKPAPSDIASEKSICSDYATRAWDYLFFQGRIGFAVSTNGRFAIANPNINNLSDFETSIADTQICYELATPFTIQLTPQQIQLLKGQNTITASTGQISVTVNGVSGAIGQVQEQVNEIAEDVENITSVRSATAGTNVTIDGGGYITVGNMVIVNIEFTADDNIASNTVLLNLPNELLTNTPINIYNKATYDILSKGRIYNGKLMASEQVVSSSSYYVAGVYIKS